MTAKSLADGKTLWSAPAGKNYMKSTEIFVADGLVWSRDLKGHDPKTGKVVRTLVQEMTGPMSHDRCYRNRITHRYYLNSASGGSRLRETGWNGGDAESLGAFHLRSGGDARQRHALQRPLCLPVRHWHDGHRRERILQRLRQYRPALHRRDRAAPGERACVWKRSKASAATTDDWPTYRYSSMRSGVTPGRTPETLTTKWKVDVGSHPTAPVVAGDSVYVADRDGYTLYSLNRESGETRWTFIADGRIDSPPTYYKGMILVGSRGGSVYCLRASDGQLAWKFNGMPQRRLICDTGRLESAWPVHGSIMIFDDTAYFAAGRSTFLDGGIAVFGLDPVTGAMKHGRIMQGPYRGRHSQFPGSSQRTVPVGRLQGRHFLLRGQRAVHAESGLQARSRTHRV